MSISEPFVRRPIATSLLMGALLVVGLVAFPLLPVAPLPQVDFPTIIAYRKGAPVRIRDVGVAVLGPQNVQMGGWQWVKGWPHSKPGVTLIVFKQPGANVVDVIDRIQQMLPHGASPRIDDATPESGA